MANNFRQIAQSFGAPYYDDFDKAKSKNYVKMLYNPGYALQARELTQSQTMLQNQIASVGSYLFKDGSAVEKGDKGDTGAPGADGAKGEKGDKGETGETGALETNGKIVVLATGGTIAGVGDPGKIAGYKPGTLTAEVLLWGVPEIDEVADIEVVQVCNVNSDDITAEIWLELALDAEEIQLTTEGASTAPQPSCEPAETAHGRNSLLPEPDRENR